MSYALYSSESEAHHCHVACLGKDSRCLSISNVVWKYIYNSIVQNLSIHMWLWLKRILIWILADLYICQISIDFNILGW